MTQDPLTTQLNHRSVRRFTAQPLGDALCARLIAVTQRYVDGNGQLFIFVLDQHRAAALATAPDLAVLGSADKFLQAAEDTVLATQNVVNAAEALGLGTVILGSVLNDAQALIDLLALPPLTFPLLGLIVGYPDQATAPKPRMPQSLMAFDDQYGFDPQAPAVAAYDATVADYYAHRATNQRAESFTHLLTHSATATPAKRGALLDTLHRQGFLQA